MKIKSTQKDVNEKERGRVRRGNALGALFWGGQERKIKQWVHISGNRFNSE